MLASDHQGANRAEMHSEVVERDIISYIVLYDIFDQVEGLWLKLWVQQDSAI